MRIGRNVVAGVCAILCGVSVILAYSADWTSDLVHSEDRIVNIADELLASAAVRDALSEALVNQILDPAQIEELISHLPSFLQGAARTAVNEARDQLTGVIEDTLANSNVRDAWREAVASFREQLVDQNQTELTLGIDEIAASINDDVENILDTLREFIGLSPDFGRVTVLTEDQVPELWQTMLRLESWDAQLPWFAFGFGLFALVIARDRFVIIALGAGGMSMAAIYGPIALKRAQDEGLSQIGTAVNKEVADLVWHLTYQPLADELVKFFGIGIVIGGLAIWGAFATPRIRQAFSAALASFEDEEPEVSV